MSRYRSSRSDAAEMARRTAAQKRRTDRFMKRNVNQLARGSANALVSLSVMTCKGIYQAIKWIAIATWYAIKWLVKGLIALGALIAQGASYLMGAIAKWIDSRKSQNRQD